MVKYMLDWTLSRTAPERARSGTSGEPRKHTRRRTCGRVSPAAPARFTSALRPRTRRDWLRKRVPFGGVRGNGRTVHRLQSPRSVTYIDAALLSATGFVASPGGIREERRTPPPEPYRGAPGWGTRSRNRCHCDQK